MADDDTTLPTVPQVYDADSSNTSQIPQQTDEDRLWCYRLTASMQIRDAALKQGEEVRANYRGLAREYEERTFSEKIGAPPPDADQSTTAQVEVPKIASLVEWMLPHLIHRDPAIRIDTPNPLPVNVQGEANLWQKLLGTVMRKEKILVETRQAVISGVIMTAGCVELGWNPVRRCPTAQQFDIRDWAADLDCNGHERVAQWKARRFEIPLEEARELYGDWIKPSNKPFRDRLKERLAGQQLDDPLGQKMVWELDDGFDVLQTDVEGTDSKYDQRKQLWRIWKRGNPKDLNDTEGYEVIIYDLEAKRVLARKPWPFVLEHDEFPIKEFVPVVYPNQIITWSPFASTLKLAKWIGRMYSYMATQARNASERKGWYDPEMLKGDSDIQRAVQQFKMGGDGQMIPIPGSAAMDAKRIMGWFEMPPMGIPIVQAIGILEGAWAMGSQQQDFSSGAMAQIQKTGVAEITQSRAEVRLAMLADLTQEFMSDIQNGMKLIAKSLMTAQDVAMFTQSPELLGQPSMQPDPNGLPVTTYEFWSDSETPAAIRSSNRIAVLPGSMQWKSPEELAQSEFEVYQLTTQMMMGVDTQLRQFGYALDPLLTYLEPSRRAAAKIGMLRGIDTSGYLPPDNAVILAPQMQMGMAAPPDPGLG